MKKTMTAAQAQGLANVLIGVDLKQLSGKAKVELTRVMLALRPAAKTIEDARQEALEKLTDGHDEDQRLLERKYAEAAGGTDGEKMTAEEMSRATEWEKELSAQLTDAMKDVANKEHDITLTKLSDDALSEVYDALPQLTHFDLMYLQDMLAEDNTYDGKVEELNKK